MMVEGEYTSGTVQPEEAMVVSGVLSVLLSSKTEWKVYATGRVLSVSGNNEFYLQMARPTSYLCRYL